MTAPLVCANVIHAIPEPERGRTASRLRRKSTHFCRILSSTGLAGDGAYAAWCRGSGIVGGSGVVTTPKKDNRDPCHGRHKSDSIHFLSSRKLREPADSHGPASFPHTGVVLKLFQSLELK